MKLHFMKRKGSRSDLQVAVSGWENQVMGTECDKNVYYAPREEFCVYIQVFLRCQTAFDNGFYIYL